MKNVDEILDGIVDGVIDSEGSEFTNDPSDSGGPTKYGVTQRTLSKYLGRPATLADVQNLDEHTARLVYRHLFFEQPGYDRVLIYSELIAAELVDSGVNCGPARASEWLQRTLNVLNNQGVYYLDLKVDGDVGPATLAALEAYLMKRGVEGERVLFHLLNCMQGAHYIELAERRVKDEKYVYGWAHHRVSEQLS